MTPLSDATRRRLNILFSGPEREEAAKLLEERCGDGLPLTGGGGEDFYDRVRFAVLKLSDGDLAKLKWWVEDANSDWRNVLVDAGFGHDPAAHRKWLPGGSKRR